MDAPIGNMSPNFEAEELCRQEMRDCSISNWKAVDEATMRTDAWSSDEEHEPLPHRHGEEAEAERMLRKRKQWGRIRYVEIWDPILQSFSRASLAIAESHRPSRAQVVHRVTTVLISQGRGLESAKRLSSCIGERFRRGLRNQS